MNEDFKLYLDLDGVLVDFARGFLQITDKFKPNQVAQALAIKAVEDQAIFNKGVSIWSNMPWIRGGKELWEASLVLFKQVYILSSTGTANDPEAGKMVELGKRKWVEKHIPQMKPENVIIVDSKDRKPQYATKFSILVDDMPITIQRWNNRGGYGILHDDKYYQETIETLKDIVKPLSLTELAKQYMR